MSDQELTLLIRALDAWNQGQGGIIVPAHEALDADALVARRLLLKLTSGAATRYYVSVSGMGAVNKARNEARIAK